MGTSPQNCIRSLSADCSWPTDTVLPTSMSWPQYNLYPHATCSIVYILSNGVRDTYLRWNCVPTFAVYCRSFSGTQWVLTFSAIVASSDFTSKSSDYVLSKAGLFSTKLSLSLPELSYFTRYNAMNRHFTKSLFFTCNNHQNHRITPGGNVTKDNCTVFL